jgi:hypothetical protein
MSEINIEELLGSILGEVTPTFTEYVPPTPAPAPVVTRVVERAAAPPAAAKVERPAYALPDETVKVLEDAVSFLINTFIAELGFIGQAESPKQADAYVQYAQRIWNLVQDVISTIDKHRAV